jgi:ABC-type antimicrobial peptide transport system permease subunit
MEVQRGAGYLQILGKLNPGINIERAEAEMRTIASSLEQQYQESNALIKTCLFITCDLWRAAFPTFWRQRFGMTLLTGLAGLALVLVVIGIFSVMSFLVALWMQEIGIRTALRAQRRDVLRWS